jgi:hypothetical protein
MIHVRTTNDRHLMLDEQQRFSRSTDCLVATFEWDCPDHHHVVDGRQRRADERANPEDPLHDKRSISRSIVIIIKLNPL